MSVEIVPKSENYWNLGISNNTWFTMINKSGSYSVIGEQWSNDPLDVSKEDSEKIAEFIKNWTPPNGWYARGEELSGRDFFVEFFMFCDGFTTS